MLSTVISAPKLIYTSYPTLVILASAILLFALMLYASAPERRFSIDVPTLSDSPHKQKKRWRWTGDKMMMEAYRKFPNQVFQVWTSEGPEIIIPQCLIDELKAMPDTALSASAALAEVFQSRHTSMPIGKNESGIIFTKTNLTKNIGKILPGMIEELTFVLPQHFESYPDWTTIEPHPKFTALISSLTARINVGPSLCRLSSWLRTTESYAKDVFVASAILKLFPPFSRPLLKNLIPSIWKIRRHNLIAATVVREALKDKIGNEVEKDGMNENSQDATHFIWELLSDDLKRDFVFQGKGQLALATAGIHSTSRLLTQAVYSLAEHPEYAPMLRDEIENVKSNMQDGANWTITELAQLRKLDSFLKETLRMYPGGFTAFRRKVLIPITLSNGLVLPAGSYISAASCGISMSADFYTSPDKFYGLRFYDMRNIQSETDLIFNRHQLSAISSISLAFGVGKHACPGRFFAAVQVKLVMVDLLSKYEFRLKEGEGRPGDVVFNAMRMVKKGGEVLVRDLKGECRAE